MTTDWSAAPPKPVVLCVLDGFGLNDDGHTLWVGVGKRYQFPRHDTGRVRVWDVRIDELFLAPILAFWLGFGIFPKLVVIALVSFFSIVVTTLAGFATSMIVLLLYFWRGVSG